MIRVDIENLREVLRQIPDQQKARKIMMRAINRAIPTARKTASQKVRERYNVNATKVRNSGKVTKATTSTLKGQIKWSEPMTNLKNYKTKIPKRRPGKPLTKQMSASIERGKMVEYKGAFTGPNGQIFRRTSRSRLPIKAVLGPSISQLMRAQEVTNTAQNKAQQMLIRTLQHEISRL